MTFTAQQIDKACQSGLFCYVGNRQKILGCDSGGGEHSSREVAPTGQAWVHHAGTLAWELVPLNSIVIENSRKEDTDMPIKGKGRDGAVTHIGRKKSSKKAAAKANNGNLELLPDDRRIAAIEDAEEARQSASEAISKAQSDYEEAAQAVIDAMHENGFTLKKRPVYTRAPWGSVSLQQKGEVKETVKFTPIKKKAASKKKSDEEED